MDNHRTIKESLNTTFNVPIGDIYEFRIEGQLSPTWCDWFDGLELTCLENGQSVLIGPVQDQAALHGLLAKIRDLNLKLIMVRKID